MSIQEHLNKIRNAIYGREVRESIAKGIETAYDDASEKDNANMEVKIARGTHPTLRDRLNEVDNTQQQTTAQLAQKVGGGELAGMGDLSQEVKEAMTGGSVAVVGKGAVNTETLAEDTKELVGIEPVNLHTTTIVPGLIDSERGVSISDTNRRRTDYVPIDGNRSVYTNRLTFTSEEQTSQIAVFYDKDKNFLGSVTSNTEKIEPIAGSKYLRMTVVLNADTETFDPENFIVWQEYKSTTKEEVDYLSNIVNNGGMNLFKGETVQGVINVESGSPTQTNDPEYRMTDLMEIESNLSIKTNWYSEFTPKTRSEQIGHIFYDVNKVFIRTILRSDDSEVMPPKNAKFVRYNIAAPHWQVDTDSFVVTQRDNRISELEWEIKQVDDKVLEVKKTVDDLLLEKGFSANNMIKVKVYDFYNPSLTHSQIIRECLDFTATLKERVLIFDTIDWKIDEAILLPSNTVVIVDGVKIKQNNEVFDNVFRGDNLEIDPENPYHYPLSISPIEHIYIYGINDAKIEGPDINQKGTHPTRGEQDMVGDFWGWRTLQISFSKCENFEVSGFDFEKTRCWTMSFDKCSHFKIHDINVNSNVKNGDGVNVRFGCHDFEVYDITGSTSDDSVAINTIDYFPRTIYVYPMEPSAFENDELPTDELNIYNGYVGGVHTTGNHHGVIVLANSGRKVHDILINNIKEPTQSTRESVVKIYSGYGSGYNANDIHSIRVNDVLSKGATHAVQITHKVDDVWINKVVQKNANGSVSSIAYEEGVTLTSIG